MPADPPPAEILVVDLLGGIGDLVMALPVIHGLGERFPTARLRVVTHEPGAQLLHADPAVTEIRTPPDGKPGAERTAVAEALAQHPPDLAITTTRYDGIPSLLADASARSVTDLWRNPPPDEPVGERYLGILHAEGVLPATDLKRRPTIRITALERRRGARTIANLLRPTLSVRRRHRGAGRPRPFAYRPPVVLVTDAGMAVKRWPNGRWHQLADALRRAGHPVLTVPSRGRARSRAGARDLGTQRTRQAGLLSASRPTRRAGASRATRRPPTWAWYPATPSVAAARSVSAMAGPPPTRRILRARPFPAGRTTPGRWARPLSSIRRTTHFQPRQLVGGLRQLAACFAAVGRRGGIVVGADTGPMRIAAAAGAATIALFGPTDARRYGLSSMDIQGLPDCPHRQPTAITEQPCWWTAACPLESANGADPACMGDIAVPTVLAAVRALTQRRPPARTHPLSAQERADRREG